MGSKTQDVLIEMLTENTGRHMLDSGGAYGRHWQRNQDRDFKNEPTGKLEFSVYNGKLSIESVLSVFHWLDERVEFDPELQKRFDAFASSPEFEDEHWLTIMEAFPKSIGASGLYGDNEPFIVNTYNNEDILSQTLQFVYFEVDNSFEETKIEDGAYVALQIHGGCDVRGGYTDPRLFRVSVDDYSILDNHRATICPEGDPEAPEQIRIPGTGYEIVPVWDTDNAGYTWTSEYFDDLGDYPVVESDDPADWTRGTLRVDSEGNGYCPVTGYKLVIYGY